MPTLCYRCSPYCNQYILLFNQYHNFLLPMPSQWEIALHCDVTLMFSYKCSHFMLVVNNSLQYSFFIYLWSAFAHKAHRFAMLPMPISATLPPSATMSILTIQSPSQITSLTVVYSIVYSGADQRNHQRSASLAFVRGIHRDRWIPRTKGQ